jgi:hypothetical protein
LFSFFRNQSASNVNQIPEIYSMSLTEQLFIESDVKATYTKILTDVVERCHGMKPELEKLLWDSCVQNEAQEGLITHLATAMYKKSELFLVYVPSVEIIRKATPEETEKIRADYKKTGDSKIGVFISFKNYQKTSMLLIYSTLEYCILSSLHKTVNIAKAVQLKLSELRSSVALADASVAVEQATSIADALRKGDDVLIDAKDSIETATPNIEPTEKAIGFLDTKKSFVLGLPQSYIGGIQTGGIGSTGEADARAVDRGLKPYFSSIIAPAVKALFDIEIEYRSQDYAEMTSALEVLKTFDLVSDENISRDSKRQIIARVFDLDPKKELKALEEQDEDVEDEPEPPAINPVGAPPPGRFA